MVVDGQTCQICYTKIHPKRQPLAATPCRHDEICGLCHLRIRHLHQDKNCPICKAPNEQIVVGDKPFEEYHIWGDDLGSDFVYHDTSGMFFPKEYFQSTVQSLFQHDCHVKDCPHSSFDALKPLQEHLRKEHRLNLCQLCVDHKRDFIDRLPRYAPAGLARHFESSQGHPLCEFCRPLRFYDLTALHSHLSKEHYKCHLCEQHLDLPNQFFRDYGSLHRHFEQFHYACGDPQCLSARFVAFATELDLRHHERHVHGAPSNGSTKIQLQFRTARRTVGNNEQEEADGGFDNNAFVPPSLPRSGDNRLHPQHEQRTEELRREAAMLRDQQDDAAAFPSLAESQDQQDAARLTIGWSSDSLQRVGRLKSSIGQVTEEAFPSLPPSRSTGGPKLTVLRPQTKAAVSKVGLHGNAARNLMAGPTPSVAATRPPQTISSSANLTASDFPSLPAPTPSSNNGQWRATKTNNNVPKLIAARATVDLSSSNFPSLAPSKAAASAPKYAAAQTLAKKLQSPASVSSAYHPLIAHQRMSHTAVQPQAVKAAPNTESPSSFPALPAAADASTLGNMKVILGTTIYKALKSYTKEYSMGELSAQAYIDYAASVFEGGYSDPNFWKFVPALVESCPTVNPAAAKDYLHELRKLRNGAINAEAWNRTMSQKESDDAPSKQKAKKKGSQAKELQAMAFR